MIKKEKEKKIVLENLTTIGRNMVDEDLSESKEQSIKDFVEEKVKMTPHKIFNKRKGRIWLGQIKSQAGKRCLPLCQRVGKELRRA
jgi:hypothetical protein